MTPVPQSTNGPFINQVTKHAEIPQTQNVDKVVDMPVVTQRQVPQIQTALKTVEAPPAQFVGRVVEAPEIVVRKHVEIPQTY